MIEIRGLTKIYGAIRAVDDITLTIKEGEVFGLLGPNGAGKTTTIRMLTTLTKPDAGSCSISGLDTMRDAMALKSHFGVVPQEINLDRELSVYENLLIYAMLHCVANREKAIRQTLEMVDLWDRRESLVLSLSGGMKRRLLIARALLPGPAVLFLDEPSIGLDPQIRRQMWDVIRKTRIEGRTVVITTHYIEEAEALCDRVGILSRGRLIALDTPAGLKKSVGAYVVEFIDEIGRLVQEICQDREEAHAKAQVQNGSVTVRKSNLEDVFVKLTGERIE